MRRSGTLPDAYRIALTVGINAALGFVYWVVAARLHSPETFGLSAAIISAAQLIASCGVVNLPATIMRFLPLAGCKARAGVGGAYLLAVGISAILAAAFTGASWAGAFGSTGAAITTSFVTAAAFMLAACSWAIFILQDVAVFASGGSRILPLENGVYGAVKLVLLILLVRQGVAGIVLSWFLPAALATLPINRYLFRRLLPNPRLLHTTTEHTRAAVRRFLLVGLIGYTVNVAVATSMPLVVASLTTRRNTAFFAAAWSLAVVTDVFLVGFPISLLVAGSRAPSKVRAECRAMLKHYVPLVLTVAVALGVVGPLALRVYGTNYAAAGGIMLEWCAAGLLFRCARVTVASIACVESSLGLAVGSDTTASVVFIVTAALFIERYGIVGAGIAYTLSNLVGLMVIAPAGRRSRSLRVAA